jgi:alkylation response protein AidB-like acyl-CoA dehydrogenase
MTESQDLASFRRELGSWLDANAPASLAGRGDDALNGVWGGRKWAFRDSDQKRWLERAAERGLTAPTWPREYGGGGLTAEEAKVLRQEIGARRLPAPLIGFGLTMIGPTLLRFGSEEQKREHLPKICRGEIRWCQGYSEPGAGSDLAALQTQAQDDGDHFIIDGTKVWTSYADQSDWIFALVRTDPEAKKQEGITFLLIDMETPGVSVSPIRLISGSSPFCETHFQSVRVPKANVVNGVNGGWTVAKALLSHERGMIATVQRARDAAKAGHQPGPESSIFKIFATELNQRRYDLLVRLAGPQALGWEGPGFEPEELERTRDWLRSRGNTIEGGTSEIQRNIIAKRVLGLPD